MRHEHLSLADSDPITTHPPVQRRFQRVDEFRRSEWPVRSRVSRSSAFANWDRIVCKEFTSNSTPYLTYCLNLNASAPPNRKLRVSVAIGGTQYWAQSTTSINTGSWQHVVGVYDGSSLRLYVNGAADGTPVSVSGSVDTVSQVTEIGHNILYSCACQHFIGTIDEVRISNVARSADWIGTGYNNHIAPGTFYSVGGQESSGGSSSGTRFDYWPYGEEKPSATTQDRDKFATYFRDHTGLDYANQRYFTSGTGRFLTSDPFERTTSPDDSGSWNQYAYTRGDPVNRIDPNGTFDVYVSFGFDGSAYGFDPLSVYNRTGDLSIFCPYIEAGLQSTDWAGGSCTAGPVLGSIVLTPPKEPNPEPRPTIDLAAPILDGLVRQGILSYWSTIDGELYTLNFAPAAGAAVGTCVLAPEVCAAIVIGGALVLTYPAIVELGRELGNIVSRKWKRKKARSWSVTCHFHTIGGENHQTDLRFQTTVIATDYASAYTLAVAACNQIGWAQIGPSGWHLQHVSVQ